MTETVSLAIAITPGSSHRVEWWANRAALMLEGFCAVQGRYRVGAVRTRVKAGKPGQVIVACETEELKP